MRSPFKLSCFFLGALAVSGCSSGAPPGELVVEVATDMSLPKDIDSVRVEILGTNGVVYNNQTYFVGPQGLHIPATIGIISANATATATVRVTAILNEQPVIIREAVSEVPPSSQQLLRLPLDFLCTGTATVPAGGQGSIDTVTDTCPSGQSCVEGTCTSDSRSLSSLEPYNNASVFGGDAGDGGGACFDTTACFAVADPVTPSLPDCTLQVPPGVSTSDLNVALVPSNGAGICATTGNSCFVPIDHGGEGWTLSGSTLQLPKGVCKPFALTTPFKVVLSSSCPSKPPSVPTCGPWSSAGHAEPTLDGGILPKGDAGKDATVGDARIDATREGGGHDTGIDGAAQKSVIEMLNIPGALLVPAFSSSVMNYSVQLNAAALGAPFKLSLDSPAGTVITVQVNGSQLGDGGVGQSIPLATLKPTVIALNVQGPDPDGGFPPAVTYTLTVPPLQQAFIKMQNPEAYAYFGAALALSANGSTLAVGAPDETGDGYGINGDAGPGTGQFNSGAVFVYTRADGGTTWTQEAYLKADMNDEVGGNGAFGSAIALSNDGNTLAVGANEESSSNEGSGTVYVFARVGSTWSQLPAIESPSPAGAFGYSVALGGDGGTTLLVGAPEDSNSGVGIGPVGGSPGASPGSGAVFLYAVDTSASTLTPLHEIKTPVNAQEVSFGLAVAMSTDGTTFAVSATGDSSNGTGVNMPDGGGIASSSGAVYVYARQGASWTTLAETPTFIKPSNTTASAQFGNALAMSSDGTVLAVGAANATVGDGGPYAAGTAYVFANQGGAWKQTGLVEPFNVSEGANFGYAVALSSDGGVLLAGAAYESSSAVGINDFDASFDSGVVTMGGSGAAYLFAPTAGAWGQQAYVKRPIPPPVNDPDFPVFFGTALALSPEGTLIIGANGDSSGGPGIDGNETDAGPYQAGAVHVFR